VKNLFIIIAISLCTNSIKINAKEVTAGPAAPETKQETKVETKPNETKSNNKSWYFSWGYNREHWGKSDIHVKQSSLGNDFVIHNVEASDYPGVLLSSDLTVPQFSFRVGKFINEDHTLAIEFNMDHTKYNNNIGQVAQVTGRINNQYVDINHVLDDNYFYYVLHNGANHIMMNFVKITPLIGENEQSMSLSAISRAGVGILFPHSGNTILGNKNSVGKKSLGNCCGFNHGWWQVNGWTAGVELGGRFMFYRPVYLEATIKEAYGKLYNVPVYQGTADQSLWMTEGVLSMGFLY
jgi:hypothetical protein